MRRFFRLHLATCVAISFVCGGLIWANVAPTFQSRNEHLDRAHPARTFIGLYIITEPEESRVIGWPLIWYDNWQTNNIDPFAPSYWRATPLAVDFIVHVEILIGATVLFEWWMRTRRRIALISN